ncbi:MAG: amidohydrolase [Chitinophagales bacterium]|nr:amidohydrolase [Chitinophagales bacterium]
MKEIDIHSHVFNIHFLPAAGAVYGYTAANLKNPLPIWICKAIGNYFKGKTQEGNNAAIAANFYNPGAQSSDFDMEDFCQYIYNENDHATIQNELLELEKYVIENHGEDLLSSLNLPQGELDAFNLNPSDSVNQYLQSSTTNGNVGMFYNAPHHPAFFPKLRRLIRIISNISEKVRLYLNWFRFMTNGYYDITQKLFDQYSDIELFIHHDMDMEAWYPVDTPKYDYDTEQVPKISELILHPDLNRIILPFYAYNPKKTLDNLKKAILGTNNDINTSKGYLGVKFYPPNGFRAWYDQTEPGYVEEYQKRHEELYQFCVDHHIPVFTHCNYGGMESGKDAYKYSDVKYWSKVLSHYPDLRLCFGHSGGHEGWLNHFDNERMQGMGHDTFQKSFPGQIYELCIKYPNVYCEFGYTPEVKTDAGKEEFVKQLKKCIDDSQNSLYPFNTKMIYGTDWHMLMQDGIFAEYLDLYKDIFNSPTSVLKDYTDSFFYLNALEYLNLSDYIDRHQNSPFSVLSQKLASIT